MNVLSLFDGISIAQQALKNLNIKINSYYSSEIDKYAISITQNNFPKTIQLGDIKQLGKEISYPKELLNGNCDIIIFGSPCIDLSIAKKNRQGLKGKSSGLFFDAVRIIKDLKPNFFIMENVASMSKDNKEEITKTLWNIQSVMINASLVSAQNRKRLFWVGKLINDKYEKVEIKQPEDKGILLKDILENNVDYGIIDIRQMSREKKPRFYNKGKSPTLNATMWKTPYRIGQIGKGGQGDRVYSIEGKSVSLSANGGGRGAKTGLYLIQGAVNRTRKNKKQIELNKKEKANAMTTVQTDSMVNIKDITRKLTCIEAERLQSLPDNFTAKGITEKGEVNISNTQRYKCTGNGFNRAVVGHILKNLK